MPLLSLGCAPGIETEVDPEAAASAYALQLDPIDAASILALVDDPATDQTTLDTAVGLDARAARNIAAFRAGADGVCPSSDDRYFDDLASLDAIPWVGDTAFQQLQAYATAHPAPASETVEGVSFRGWESQAVVWGANHLDFAAIDLWIDSRAAQALIDHRPFLSVSAMGPLPYVGPTALEKLRIASIAWWIAMRSGTASTLAGTFDGVTFDDATAAVALAIANGAAVEQLMAHGVASSPAHAVAGGRPYTTLSAVAAVSGVGPATMSALRAYASSGEWPPAGASSGCIDAFAAAVQPHLADVLFMSESDRPVDLVAFAGAGGAAPTAASVLALSGAADGSSAELRAPSDFEAAFEPASATADPNASAAIDAALAGLTDVVYVAIHAPAGSPDIAIVNVYLVGRTSCGDLVGVHSIAIET